VKAIEFQNLVQGDITVEQYSSRFIELTWFTANLIPDEELKVERFVHGLNPRIKGVICHEIKDHVKLVVVASLAKRGIREPAAYDLKRQQKQQTSQSERRQAIENDFEPIVGRNFPPALRNWKPSCKTCGKLHAGGCRMVKSSCFNCGRINHY
jgi:hypothetical protein